MFSTGFKKNCKQIYTSDNNGRKTEVNLSPRGVDEGFLEESDWGLNIWWSPPPHKNRDIFDLSLQIVNAAGYGSVHPPLQHHPGCT